MHLRSRSHLWTICRAYSTARLDAAAARVELAVSRLEFAAARVELHSESLSKSTALQEGVKQPSSIQIILSQSPHPHWFYPITYGDIYRVVNLASPRFWMHDARKDPQVPFPVEGLFTDVRQGVQCNPFRGRIELHFERIGATHKIRIRFGHVLSPVQCIIPQYDYWINTPATGALLTYGDKVWALDADDPSPHPMALQGFFDAGPSMRNKVASSDSTAASSSETEPGMEEQNKREAASNPTTPLSQRMKQRKTVVEGDPPSNLEFPPTLSVAGTPQVETSSVVGTKELLGAPRLDILRKKQTWKAEILTSASCPPSVEAPGVAQLQAENVRRMLDSWGANKSI